MVENRTRRPSFDKSDWKNYWFAIQTESLHGFLPGRVVPKKNVQFIWDYFEQGKPTGYHDGIQLITFLENVPDTNKSNKYWPIVNHWLRQPGTIERDPLAEGYLQKVLDWCPNSESYSRKFVSAEEVQNHLQALVNQQDEDGGWPINWTPLSRGTELEWRGWITVERLRTLKSYQVI